MALSWTPRYARAWGDWTDLDPARFPGGLGAVAAAVRRRKLRPGLWVAPFAAGTLSTRRACIIRHSTVQGEWMTTPGCSQRGKGLKEAKVGGVARSR